MVIAHACIANLINLIVHNIIMFWRPKDKNSYYYGSDTYKYINGMIKSSRKMQIVSPYIDEYYADFMLRNSGRTEFYVISSSLDENARKMLSGKSSRIILSAYAIVFALLLYFEIAVGIGGYLLATPFVLFLFFASRHMYIARRKMRIRLKVPSRFVHAKMYISEDQAVSGSANLTYKGTHSNIEHINIIRDREEVERLRKQFWEMWKAY